MDVWGPGPAPGASGKPVQVRIALRGGALDSRESPSAVLGRTEVLVTQEFSWPREVVQWVLALQVTDLGSISNISCGPPHLQKRALELRARGKL